MCCTPSSAGCRARSGCSSRCWPSGLPSGPIICWGEPKHPLFFCHLGLLACAHHRERRRGNKRHQVGRGVSLLCCGGVAGRGQGRGAQRISDLAVSAGKVQDEQHAVLADGEQQLLVRYEG